MQCLVEETGMETKNISQRRLKTVLKPIKITFYRVLWQIAYNLNLSNNFTSAVITRDFVNKTQEARNLFQSIFTHCALNQLDLPILY